MTRQLTNNEIRTIFFQMRRKRNEDVYWDTENDDLVGYATDGMGSGYFSSFFGDQTLENRKLLAKFQNGEPSDLVDPDVYIYLPHIKIGEFLDGISDMGSSNFPLIDQIINDYIKQKSSYVDIRSCYFANKFYSDFWNLFNEVYDSADPMIDFEIQELYLKLSKKFVFDFFAKNAI